jgi:hypothetical protein
MLWGFMKVVDIYVNHSRDLCHLCQNSVMVSKKLQQTFMPEMLI